MGARLEPSSSWHLRFAGYDPVAPCAEAADTWSAGLSDNAASGAFVQSVATVHDSGHAGREAGNGRDGITECRAVAEKRLKSAGRSAGGRGDRCVAFANVAVGGTSAETRRLRVQRFHVRHRFFGAKGAVGQGLLRAGGGQIRRWRTRKRVTDLLLLLRRWKIEG
jgi:hypothetical protein